MALDPVNHKALKGKFKDREDKDIDNDGDSDSSDEYLHKRRQAVSKAIGKIKEEMAEERKGLWDNIHAKRKRIAAGSGEKMRKPGSKGAPTNADFRNASESVEHITESENRDYIKTVLSRHLNNNKVTHKVSSAVGYDKFDVGNNTHISHDGVGLSVKHKGKEVAYYSKPRLEYKDAAKAALKHSMKEEVEQIDEIQINWNHKTQKYHTIKHPDGSHWGVFDHSSYGTKGHEIRKIKDSDGNAIKASDSRKSHSTGYKSGMGSPADAAKAWAKKHGGTIINHKIKEETEELDEISRDLARRYIRKVADKTNTGELSTKQVMKRRPGVNLAGKKAYPGIAGEPKVRATESTEFKTEAKDGDGANIVRDREFKEPKFKFKSHPYGSPEWHANKAAHEKFKAQQAAKAAKKAMKNEEVEKNPTELPADKKPLRMKLAHFRHQE